MKYAIISKELLVKLLLFKETSALSMIIDASFSELSINLEFEMFNSPNAIYIAPAE